MRIAIGASLQGYPEEYDTDTEDATRIANRTAEILRSKLPHSFLVNVFDRTDYPGRGDCFLDMARDINAWGARIGSLSPLDTPGTVEITFAPPGEMQKVHIAGEVVWSRLIPEESQYHAGVEFCKSIDQLHREGKI